MQLTLYPLTSASLRSHPRFTQLHSPACFHNPPCAQSCFSLLHFFVCVLADLSAPFEYKLQESMAHNLFASLGIPAASQWARHSQYILIWKCLGMVGHIDEFSFPLSELFALALYTLFNKRLFNLFLLSHPSSYQLRLPPIWEHRPWVWVIWAWSNLIVGLIETALCFQCLN